MKSALLLAAALVFTSNAFAQAPKIETDFSKQLAGEYVLDLAHASVTWRVTHFGLSHYTARFDKMAGKIQLAPGNAANSRAEFSIEAASVNTGLAPFNKKLMAPEFFDGEKNPQINFKSTKFEHVSGQAYKLTGDMTLRGVTKPITWNVTFNGGLYNSYAQAQATGFSAKGVVKRSDWGMKEYAGIVGDDVEVIVEAEFNNRAQPQ